MEGIVCVTYRCNAKCHMCNIWQHPTRPQEEIRPDIFEKLPRLKFVNITGGESLTRKDLEGFVERLKLKGQRIVISTNSFFTDRIVRLAERHKDKGIRISLEGLPKANDELRGITDSTSTNRTTVSSNRYFSSASSGNWPTDYFGHGT